MRPFPSEEAFTLQELVYHKATENRRPGRSQEPKNEIAPETKESERSHQPKNQIATEKRGPRNIRSYSC
jgi:hypothetical protein